MKQESSKSQRDASRLRHVVREPHSRRKFMLLAGGSSVAGVALASCGEGDETVEETTGTTGAQGGDGVIAEMFGEGDLGIVNYALTLEYLEAAFYDEVANSGLFSGDDLKLIKTFGDHEQQHVDALLPVAMKLGEPAAKPKTKFQLEDAESVLQTAAEVENLGAAAYLGQVAAIEDEGILKAAASIHTVEGRHAATLNTIIGEKITPDGPFAEPAPAQKVLDSVQPFIAS